MQASRKQRRRKTFARRHQSVWRLVAAAPFGTSSTATFENLNPAHCPSNRRFIPRCAGSQPALSAAKPDLAVLAGNIVLGRYVAGHVPPMTLSCVRWIGVYLILCRSRGRIASATGRLAARLPLWCCCRQPACHHNCPLYWRYSTPGAERAVDSIVRAAVRGAVVASAVRVRLTWAQLSGIAISLAGVLTSSCARLCRTRRHRVQQGRHMLAGALLASALFGVMPRRPVAHHCR